MAWGLLSGGFCLGGLLSGVFCWVVYVRGFFVLIPPWLKDTEGALCFICEEDIENTYHFFLDCPHFKENFDSVWHNLQLKVTISHPTDGSKIANFIKNLNRQNKVMLLVGGLSLPFDNQTTTLVKKFVSSAVGKIYKFAPRNYVSWRHRG